MVLREAASTVLDGESTCFRGEGLSASESGGCEWRGEGFPDGRASQSRELGQSAQDSELHRLEYRPVRTKFVDTAWTLPQHYFGDRQTRAPLDHIAAGSPKKIQPRIPHRVRRKDL